MVLPAIDPFAVGVHAPLSGPEREAGSTAFVRSKEVEGALRRSCALCGWAICNRQYQGLQPDGSCTRRVSAACLRAGRLAATLASVSDQYQAPVGGDSIETAKPGRRGSPAGGPLG